MLASFSHELRTPLNCSLNLLEILSEKVDEEFKENFVGPALSSNRQLSFIINDILDFSLLESH